MPTAANDFNAVAALNMAMSLSLVRVELGGTTIESLRVLLRDALVALQYEPMRRLQWTRKAAIARSAARENLRLALEALEAK